MHVPEPIVDRADGTDPEHEALLADSVGLALLVVLETLAPAERLAFVLHDMFAVPFDEIAPIVDRSPDGRAAAREPRAPPRAGRAAVPDADLEPPARGRRRLPRRRARRRLRARCVAVLDPDVVLRADCGRRARVARWSAAPRPSPARRCTYARLGLVVRPALVNGAAGVVTTRGGRAASRSAAFTVRGGKIVEIDILADPERLGRLDLTVLDGDPEAANDL